MPMSTLTLEVIESFTVREHGQVSAWQVGQRMTLSPEKAARVIERVGPKVRVVEREGVDPAIGSIVLWSHERGLVHDVLIHHDTQWIWVETATREGWTHTRAEAAARCRRCQGTRWWWSKDAAIPCGFSHDWVADHDPRTGKEKGPGHPADRDHLDECRRHRFRFTPSLAILCATCHPPMPSPDTWSAAWDEIVQLRHSLTDPTTESLVQACDAAFSHGDYPAFLREWVRLTVFVGQLVRPYGR